MTAGIALSTVLFVSAALLSQAPSAPNSSPGRFSGDIEFPVIMRQNVAAGATAVGSKVEAKLAVATLVNGVVVPQGAILSGEVVESMAKSASNPSRLAIRMDSAQWKNGAASKVLQLTKKVYLTGWYYPFETPKPRHFSDESSDTPGHRGSIPPYSAPDSTPNYPDPNATASQPFPGRDPSRSTDTIPGPPAPGPSLSQHRVLMKNVESSRSDEGAIILMSRRSSIKLDKSTTYVLASADFRSGPG
jgi:hypothetical protein